MKLEHKIGIAITCTFLCLSGAVIGLKMQEQAPTESPRVADTNASSSEENEGQQSTQESKKGNGGEDDGEKSSKGSMHETKEPPASPPPPAPSPAVFSGSTHNPLDSKNPISPKPASANSRGSNGKSSTDPAKERDDPHKQSSPAFPGSLGIRQTKGNSLGNTTPPGPVEPPPSAFPVKGNEEWDTSSASEGNGKKKRKPASPTKPTGPASAANPSSEAKGISDTRVPCVAHHTHRRQPNNAFGSAAAT